APAADVAPAEQVVRIEVVAVDVGIQASLLQDKYLLALGQHLVQLGTGQVREAAPLPFDRRGDLHEKWCSGRRLETFEHVDDVDADVRHRITALEHEGSRQAEPGEALADAKKIAALQRE